MDETKLTETEPEVEEETTGEEIETDPVDPDDDGWDDVKWDDVSEEDADEDIGGTDGEGEEPAAEEEPEKPEPEQKPDEAASDADQQAEDTDQYLELKFKGDIRKVNRDEAKTLAQKGLNYDHVLAERDNMKQDYDKLKGYESFLNELKGEFPSIEALIDDTRARVMADKEGISYADAMAKVKNMHPEPAKPAEPKGAARSDSVQAFVSKYPNVKAEEIPESVWNEVRETGDLVGAYEKYQASEKDKEKDNRIASLEAEIKTLKQNSKNAARSTGSSSSSGKTSAKSLIQQLWEDDD